MFAVVALAIVTSTTISVVVVPSTISVGPTTTVVPQPQYTVPQGFSFCSPNQAICTCPLGRKIKFGQGEAATAEAISFGTNKWCGPGVFSTTGPGECYCEDGAPAPENLPGCNEELPLGWDKCGVSGTTCNCTAPLIRFGCKSEYYDSAVPTWNYRWCAAGNDLIAPATFNPADGAADCLCGCDSDWVEYDGCCRFGNQTADFSDKATIVAITKKADCRKACNGQPGCKSWEFWKNAPGGPKCELFNYRSDQTFTDSIACVNAKCARPECKSTTATYP